MTPSPWRAALFSCLLLSNACGGDTAPGVDAGPATADGSTPVLDAASGVDSSPPDAAPAPFQATCGLLENGDAENDLSGWQTTLGQFRVVEGNAFQGFPDAHQGTFSFSAGEVAESRLVQTVDVSDWADFIDERAIYAEFSGWVRSWSGDDEAALLAVALDDNGVELARAQVGRYRVDTWTPRSSVLRLPTGTREVAVELSGYRSVGNDNDAYFDALDLCLHDQPPPPPSPSAELDALPYLMWPTEDAISVRWESARANVGTVAYGPTPELGLSVSESSPTRVHEIRLTGLPPGSPLWYQVSWEGAYLAAEPTATAPLPTASTPFSFVVWGDNQNGPETFTDLVPHMVDRQPDFAFSVGDCVQNGTRAEYREQLFTPLAPLARNVPFLIAAGNHERYSDAGAMLFDEYMSQPGDEHCFGWRWGELFILFIDTEMAIDMGTPQGDCIRSQLASPEAVSATLRAAAFHKPPRIEWWLGGPLAFTYDMEAPWVREELEPLLASLDVHVVFNGHNHLYAHSPETALGTTWVTSGGAGGTIDTDFGLWRVGDWDEIETTIHDHNFLWVTVDEGVMTVEAVGRSGQVLHTFTVAPSP